MASILPGVDPAERRSYQRYCAAFIATPALPSACR